MVDTSVDLVAIGAAETWLNILTEMRANLTEATLRIENETGFKFDEVTEAIRDIAKENLAVGDSIQGRSLEVVMTKGAERWNSDALWDAIKADPNLKYVYRKRGDPTPTIRAIKG